MQRVLKTRTFSGTTEEKEQSWEREHRKIAREAAAEGMVLLKNENHLLPLEKESKVALYGAGAGKTIKGGTGSGDVNERESVSIYEGMRNAGFSIVTEAWIKEYDKLYDRAREEWKEDINRRTAGSDTMQFFNIYSTTPFVMPAGSEIVKPYEDVKTAIYVISRIAGEGADRHEKKGDYYLSDEEACQLSAISTFYENVIVIVNAGAQIDLGFMDCYKNIKALLVIVQPGMEGGNAVADILSGTVNPSGKLVDTWAYHYEDYPNAKTFSHNNGNLKKELYTEGIYVGYRYFDTFEVPVRYGFGFGLSYTEFELSEADVEKCDKTKLRVSVKVTNRGKAAGKEVVQVYASLPQGTLEKEAHRLIGFAKTKELKPGEWEQVRIEIPVSQLSSYSEKEHAWLIEAGNSEIFVGSSLESKKSCGYLRFENTIILENTKHICPPQEKFKELSAEIQQVMQPEKGKKVIPFSSDDFTTNEVLYKKNAELFEKEAMDFVQTLTLEECIKLAAGDPGKAQGGNLGAAGISVPGSAGETHSCAREKGLAGIVLADGPAGLRLMKYYHVDQGKIVQMPFQFSLENGLFYEQEKPLPGKRYYQYCTAIPVGTLLAQSWNTQLLQKVGHMIGEEMQYFGVTLWLAPGMNIHRNPLCGRNFEYYSEDPLISGKMAAAMTRGVQKNRGCGTTIKHFACNNQEDNRMGSDSVLSERTLREIYLKGFEIAVKEAQPMAMMTSYNLINGVHAANSSDLCTDAARNEWGFDGLVMTDWTTTEVDETCTAAGCMRAGNDLIMPGCFGDHENLKKELKEGTLAEADVRACIARLVHTCFHSNQYE